MKNLSDSLYDFILKFRYDSEWFDIPLKARKLVPLIILQSCKPCKMSIAKIATMNMETVSKVRNKN